MREGGVAVWGECFVAVWEVGGAMAASAAVEERVRRWQRCSSLREGLERDLSMLS